MIDFHHVQIIPLDGGGVRVVVVAEACEACGERVSYWNEGAQGNAACGCTIEGPEACDRIAMRPQIVRLLERALQSARER